MCVRNMSDLKGKGITNVRVNRDTVSNFKVLLHYAQQEGKKRVAFEVGVKPHDIMSGCTGRY